MPAGADLSAAIADKAHRDHAILAKLDFTVTAGERVAILGRSGCGKTSLLRILAGLDRDFSGQVVTQSQCTTMVFQTPTLLPWRTVRDNIALAAPRASHDRIGHLLDRLELGRYQQHFPAHLSLGMQRRVALARALAPDPDMLLADEPFASLDADSAQLVHRLLADFFGTLILVSHDIDDAQRQCQRLLLLAGQPTGLWADLATPDDIGSPAGKARLRALLAGEIKP